MKPSNDSINRELRVLDDAHRLGRIRREDYRARRRRLLATLCASDGATTARKPLIPRTPVAPAAGVQSTPVITQARSKSDRNQLMMIGAGILILGVLLVWRLSSHAAKAVTSAAPVSVVASTFAPEQKANVLDAAAQSFLRKDQWDAADIDAFLKTWRSVDAGERHRALQVASVQSLRERTVSKKKVTALLLDDDNSNSARKAQAQALQNLDDALKGK